MNCSKSDIGNDVQDCIDTRIITFKDNLICDKALVKQYLFQGQTVFVFDNQECCCDHFSEVMDVDCNLIGNLGGFAGLTKISGLDFYTNAKLIKIVWKK